jgi:hypothetical protein
MGEPSWRAINATTALAALVGILLGLAFSRPWGERLPAWLVVLPVWVGTGLLVPMLLLAPVLGPAAVARDQAAGAAPAWSYEQLFVIVPLGRGRPAARLLGLCQGALARGAGWAARRRGCARGPAGCSYRWPAWSRWLPPARRHQAVLGAGGHRRDRPRPAGRPRPLVARLDPEHGSVVAGRRLGHPGADRPARRQAVPVPHDGRLGRLGMLFASNFVLLAARRCAGQPGVPRWLGWWPPRRVSCSGW